MKKYLGVGLLAFGLIAAGGTGAYLESAKDHSASLSYMEQGMSSGNMVQMMNTADSKNNFQTLVDKQQNNSQASGFEQMLPYMKKMHPNLSDQQLKDLYEQMMGANGACGKMMGITGGTNSTDSTTSTTSSSGGNL